MDFRDNFLGQLINIVIDGKTLQNAAKLAETYGEDALDGNLLIHTLYCRQDNEDKFSRRAASLANEQPSELKDGRFIIIGLDPSIKVFEAMLEGKVQAEIVYDENLKAFLKKNPIKEKMEVI